jgi:hypothetical protein
MGGGSPLLPPIVPPSSGFVLHFIPCQHWHLCQNGINSLSRACARPCDSLLLPIKTRETPSANPVNASGLFQPLGSRRILCCFPPTHAVGGRLPASRAWPLPPAVPYLSTCDLWLPQRRLGIVYCSRAFWRLILPHRSWFGHQGNQEIDNISFQFAAFARPYFVRGDVL